MADLYRLPTRDALLAHQEAVRENGYTFPLAATSLGMDTVIQARVRRINTTDRAAIEALPTAVQETVWRGIKEFEKQQKNAVAPDSLIEAAMKNEEQMAAANAFCIAAFIDPPLVATENDLATHPGAYVVTDIAAEDRISFTLACLDADSASARQLKMFRQPAPKHVPDRPAGGLDPITTIHAAQPAG